MRIAITGAHRVGKTTLAEALVDALAGAMLVEEPYHQLADEGHDFSDPPSVEDFETQLDRSIRDLSGTAAGPAVVVFDRSPIDLVAYLLVHPDADAFDLDPWLHPIDRALAAIDLVVYVPIEDRDRIDVPRDEHPALRRAVDARIRSLLAADTLAPDADLPVLEVTGSESERLAQVLARLP